MDDLTLRLINLERFGYSVYQIVTHGGDQWTFSPNNPNGWRNRKKEDTVREAESVLRAELIRAKELVALEGGVIVPNKLAAQIAANLYNGFEPDNQSKVYLDFVEATNVRWTG